MFEELNKSFESVFTVEPPENAVYLKLVDMKPDTMYTMISCFINPKSKYGEHGVLGVQEGQNLFWLSLPQHLTGVIKQILATPAMIEAINNGKVGFTVESFFSKKYNREGHTIKFKDL